MDAKHEIKQLEVGKVCFVHGRTRRHGAVTLAARCDGRGPDGACAFVVAAAFCAPTDRWSAALGQTIAAGRLRAKSCYHCVDVGIEQVEAGRPIASALRAVANRAMRDYWELHSAGLGDGACVPRWFPAFFEQWQGQDSR